MDPYLWIKALHIVSVIAWMAGLLYLPRLFVYHAGAEPGSAVSETFKLMERRLLRAICTPALLASFGFGIAMLVMAPELLADTWVHLKFLAVVGLAAMHGFCARWRKDFAADRNRHSVRFYRIVNEVPTVLMIVAVAMVVLKPGS